MLMSPVRIPAQAPPFLDVVLFVRSLFQVPVDQQQHHVVENCQGAWQPLEVCLEVSSHCDVKFVCGLSQSQW